MKLDLLTNATVVDDAIRFVSSRSKEPDYDEDQRKQGKEIGEITSSTTNHIF
jgi:hypothetical protein